MNLKGIVSGLFFNTKEKDANGNFIQPVVVIEAEGEKKRIYLPKTQKETVELTGSELKKGDLVEITDVVESSGFLRAEPQHIKVVGADRRKASPKTSDDKQEAIWKGQAFNLAYSRAVEDQLFDADEATLKKELFANAEQALELIREWQSK